MPDAHERLTAALSDRYRIERELGRGGMATVYLAQDLRHDRQVAIKVLRPELASVLGPERFQREIQLAARLQHPNILPVFDSGDAAGQLWYAMPYVEGESLRGRLEREPQLPLEEALQVTREVAAAIGHAHQQHVIHRDIKPENILLSGGHAVVADFGIARALDAVGGEKLTETGLALGTPSYMSPEQGSGDSRLDGRSDVYALGVVLYEMLAGAPPFTGPTAQSIRARHAVDPIPSLRTVRSTVPPSVEAAITKALAKVPADRFTSAAQFVEALSQPVPPSLSAGTKKLSATLIAGTAIAILVVGGWLFARSRRPHVEPSASVIAVLPFGTNGDSALIRLSHDLVLTVSASLDGVGGIRTADAQMVLSEADDSRSGQYIPNALALGKRLGAGSVVVGSIVPQGRNVQLDLKLVSTKGDSEPLARVSVTSSPDSISALTDSITWALLRQVWRRGEPPSPSYANLTTRSMPSLRAFLDGERLSVAGRYGEAIDAYSAAIQADSSFWLAGWRYNGAQGWMEQPDFNLDLERGYRSHLAAFGERDRMLIEAEMTGDSAVTFWEHVDRFRRVAERFPADWSAGFTYADHLFHFGALIGHTNAEARAALQHTVDLNPKLASMWEHLARVSFGHDSAQAAQAVKSLMALGYWKGTPEKLGVDVGLFYRLLVSAGGQLSLTILDSLAVAIAQSKVSGVHHFGAGFLQSHGFPSAQVEMNRRLLALDPHGPYAGVAWRGTTFAWASRGAWDSALVAWDRYAAASPDTASGVEIYQLAVAGAWLGGLDTARAAGRRTAAVRYLGRIPAEDTTAVREARAALAWTDGMLAVLRRDPRGLAAARVSARQSGAEGAGFLDRSLAAFESELRGTERPAADSLAALDLSATETQLNGPHDPYARSVDHLMASRLLLQFGDTTRAARLLTWHEAKPGGPEPLFQVFAPLAYYELARIEEAQGRTEQARDHYQQFLPRYDMPPPAHQHMVDEAKASLRKLNGLNDAPATN